MSYYEINQYEIYVSPKQFNTKRVNKVSHRFISETEFTYLLLLKKQMTFFNEILKGTLSLIFCEMSSLIWGIHFKFDLIVIE